MGRLVRHESIRRLLASEPMPSQEAILVALAREGIETTQATLSRDLRRIGVVKGPRGYSLPEAGTLGFHSETDGSVLAMHTLSVTPATGLVVIRTLPGSAGAAAVELDRHPPEGVAGTVAGDDTILVALEPGASPEDVCERLIVLAGLGAEVSS